MSIPQVPEEADEEGCLGMGTVGMAINGVAFYNPYTLEQLDAVENEVSWCESKKLGQSLVTAISNTPGYCLLNTTFTTKFISKLMKTMNNFAKHLALLAKYRLIAQLAQWTNILRHTNQLNNVLPAGQ